MRLLFFFLFFLSVILHSLGQVKDVDSSAVVKDTIGSQGQKTRPSLILKIKKFIDKEHRFILAPEFGRKPETGFLTGVYFLRLFRLTSRSDSLTRTSNIEAYFDYTERRQIITEMKNNLIFKKERFILRGESGYTKFPSYFWGVGTQTTPDMKELVSFEMTYSKQRLVTKVDRKFFAGMQYGFMQVSNVQYVQGGVFDQQVIPGRFGSITSGAGLVLLFDSRDNILNAYKGLYIDASFLINRKQLGSQYDYDNVTIDVRKFISLSTTKVRILALQLLVNYNSGNVPWRQMATMGGDQIMRGYYTGRFRDKTILAGQAELRVLAWRKIGFTIFGAVAEVGPDFSTYNWNDVHYTVGICLRYMVNKKERLNIGIDTGFGYQTQGLYFNSGEAF
jgi:hypothetical protein